MVKNDTIRPGSYATVAEAKEGGGAGGDAVWGSIEGTLSNQTDLKNALDAKQDAGNYATETYVDEADGLLDERIDDVEDEVASLKSIGRYLANWDCTTGLPASEPPSSPYTYKTGDYYIVSVIGDTNYIPNGTQYVEGQASTTTTTDVIKISDIYFYDGTVWRLLVNSSRTIAIDDEMSTTSTNPVENKVVKAYVDAEDLVLEGMIDDVEDAIQALQTTVAGKQDELTAGDGIDITNNVISSDVPVVSVSDTGSTTNTISYITIDGVEKKIAASGVTPPNMMTTNTEQNITAKKKFIASYDYPIEIGGPNGIRFTVDSRAPDGIGLSIDMIQNLGFDFIMSILNLTDKGCRLSYSNSKDSTSHLSLYAHTRRNNVYDGGWFIEKTDDIVTGYPQMWNVNHSIINTPQRYLTEDGLICTHAWVKSAMPEVTFTADGTSVSYDVSHTLGKVPSIVQVTDPDGVVLKDSEITITKTTTNVTVAFNTAPTQDAVFTVGMLY